MSRSPAPAHPPSAGSPIISVRGLCRSYGEVRAVDDVSFDVAAASTFAFLGTNGAGKSTTIRCLATILEPTSGHIEIAGHVVGEEDEAVRRAIGLVFQDSVLDPSLTVRENLLLRARFYGIGSAMTAARVDELAELLDLGSYLDRRYGRLSGGQRRRADIVRALLHGPRVLFLDEPTTGLDPDSREKVWATVVSLQHELGLTVFLTTHYMEETERADSVQVIDAGRIVATGSPSQLRARFAADELVLTLSSTARVDAALQETRYDVRRRGRERRIRVRSSGEALDLLLEHRTEIIDFEFRHGTMDDVFLNLTRAEDAS